MRRSLALVLAWTAATAHAQEPASDPLADPRWHRRTRGLQAATGVFGALAGLSFVGFEAANFQRVTLGPSSDGWLEAQPGHEQARMATWAAGSVLLVSMVGLIVSGSVYDRHLERAARAPMAGLRRDAEWVERDRGLTMLMRVTAATAGIAGNGATVSWALWRGDGPGSIILPSILTIGGAVGLAALIGFSAARARHRASLDRWPRLAGGGLTIQF